MAAANGDIRFHGVLSNSDNNHREGYAQLIDGDSQSFCTVRIIDAAAEIPFQAGDTVSVRVLEDDLIGNDLLWAHSFDVDAGAVVDETFDCTSPFGEDLGDHVEIFAEAPIAVAA